MYPTKRRRLHEEAAAALNKPFRSPLRADLKKQPLLGKPETVDPETGPPSQPNRPLGTPVQLTSTSPTGTRPYPRAQRRGTSPKPERSSPSFRSRSAIPLTARDPAYRALQKQHSALSLQLTKLRQSLDTAQQALQIETCKGDVELEALIEKWRVVARDAADELFATAKDRVDEMGGMAVWRERTQKTSWAWSDEDELDATRLTDEQKEQLETDREEAVAEARKYGLVEPEMATEKDDEVSDDFCFGPPMRTNMPLIAVHDGHHVASDECRTGGHRFRQPLTTVDGLRSECGP